MTSRIFIVCFMVLGQWAAAQKTTFLQSISGDSVVDVYLRLDWRALEKKRSDKAYQEASVSCYPNDSLSMLAKVRTRGHMRLTICSFPPLKIKLDKEALAKYGYSSSNEVDVVHHCHETDFNDQLLLREFMVYKIWELISPYYFKTQLVRLHYINPDGSDAHTTAYAFLKESTEGLVDRFDGREIKLSVIGKSAVEHSPFLLFCLFEYMVGNTDWYIPTRHNIEFAGIPGNKLLIAIPYDFDYSGIVNAPYAVPHETLNASDVKIRYYQGWCEPEAEVRKQLQKILDQKENILSMPYHIQGMDDKSIRFCVDYLQDFFDIVENPKKLENQILRHCDMWPVKS